MSRPREWPPSPFNAAPTFVWVSRSEVSWNSPSRDPNQQIFCWRVTRVRPLDAGQSGTKNAVALCQGGRPSFPPSPRAWPVMLGAADMPIGCALTFCHTPSSVMPGRSRSKHGVARPIAVRRTASLRSPMVPGVHVLLARDAKNVDGRDKPGHDASDGMTEGLRRRLTLDRL